MLYGLHPVALEDRVKQAIEKMRPQLTKQGGGVELIGVLENAVRVKIHSSGHGCGSAPDKLQATVEQAILEAAPDVLEIIADVPEKSAFIPITMIQPASTEEKKYEESTA